MKHALAFVVNGKQVDVYQLEIGDDISFDPTGKGGRDKGGSAMQHITYVSEQYLKSYKYIVAINKLFRFVI